MFFYDQFYDLCDFMIFFMIFIFYDFYDFLKWFFMFFFIIFLWIGSGKQRPKLQAWGSRISDLRP